jgi:hypothetical protein
LVTEDTSVCEKICRDKKKKMSNWNRRRIEKKNTEEPVGSG